MPEDYVPMMLEEMELDGTDLRSDAWGDEVPAARREQHKVLVIGGGMSGVLAAYRLQEAGIPFVVIEKNPAVGGTWYENRYPRRACRRGQSPVLLFLRARPPLEQFFSQQKELQQYFEGVVYHHQLDQHFRFNTEVTGAAFDEANNLWTVDTIDKDGVTEQYVVNS